MSGGMDDSIGRAQVLLAQVRLMRDKYDALAAASGVNFNVFTLLGRERDEVRTHSAILADLLNPKGCHGQGTLFAQLFRPLSRFGEELGKATVWVEASIDARSRVHILIETDRSCIVIENKVHADDGDAQLRRYHEFARTRGKHFDVFYLTLRGSEPSEKSLAGLPKDQVKCISYDLDVLAWLDSCIKEMALVPQIRETLTQYRATVRGLTGKTEENLSMELKELLKARQGEGYNFLLAPDIAEACKQLSIELEWTFWQGLRDGLIGHAASGWRLELDAGQPDGLKSVSEAVIAKAHTNAQKKWDYGWTFRICSEHSRFASESQRILLRVECETHGWVFFALAVIERADQEGKWRRSTNEGGLFKNWAHWLSQLPEGWNTGYGWLGWRYPTPHVRLYKTDAFTLLPEVMRQLLEDRAIEPLVKEITESVDGVVRRAGGAVV